jgi:hypothetical protein
VDTPTVVAPLSHMPASPVGANEKSGGSHGESRLSVTFRPNAGLLTHTRAFATSFCATFIDDPDTVFCVAMAVHELLENVIKYSLEGTSQVLIDLRSESGKRAIAIRTDNRATPDTIDALREMIRRIHDADDPFDFYCRLVSESAGRDGHSGLGLARIRAEAGLELDSDINGDQVSIFAHTPIARGHRA